MIPMWRGGRVVEGGRFEIYCRGNPLPRVRIPLSPPVFQANHFGEVTEWFKVLAWNAGVGQPTVGSNPTLSATFFAILGGGRVLVVEGP